MTTRIYSHNPNSGGAKRLAEQLGIKRIRHTQSAWNPTGFDKVINWGSINLPAILANSGRIYNYPAAVALVSNKLSFFRKVDESDAPPRVPPWTSDPETAKTWVQNGATVVARTVLSGHSGVGISIITSERVDFQAAPLYTKYVKKRDEYRVHIVSGEIVDVQRKALVQDFQGERNTLVRNLAGGYVYVRGGVDAPDDVLAQALSAHRVSGLDFGAVDVIWNERHQQATVLEINSAPGLEGTSVTNYANAFRKHGYV